MTEEHTGPTEPEHSPSETNEEPFVLNTVKPPKPMRSSEEPKKRRRLLKWVVGILVLLITLLLLAPLLVNPFVRPAVISALEAKLQAKPDIHAISYSWFSGVTASEITIEQPPGFSGPAAIRIDNIRMDVSVFSLLSGNARLTRPLEIDKVELHVVQDAHGNINLSNLSKPTLPSSGGGGSPGSRSPSSKVSGPEVQGEFIVREVKVHIHTPTTTDVLTPLTISGTLNLPHGDSRLDVKGSGLEVNAAFTQKSGSSERVTGELRYQIEPGFADRFIPLLTDLSEGLFQNPNASVSGKGILAIKDDGTVTGAGNLQADVSSIALHVEQPGDSPSKIYTLSPGVINVAWQAQSAIDEPIAVDIECTSPAASIHYTGQISMAAEPTLTGDAWLRASFEELGKRYPGIITTERAFSGSLEASTRKMVLSSDSISGIIEIAGRNLKEEDTSGNAVDVFADAPSALFELDMDLQRGDITCERIEFGLGSTRIDGTLTAGGLGDLRSKAASIDLEASTLNANLDIHTDLAELLSTARRFTELIPEDLVASGVLDAKLTAKPDDSDITINLVSSASELHVSGIDALSNITLPRSATIGLAGNLNIQDTIDFSPGRLISSAPGFDLQADFTVQDLLGSPRGVIQSRGSTTAEFLTQLLGPDTVPGEAGTISFTTTMDLADEVQLAIRAESPSWTFLREGGETLELSGIGLNLVTNQPRDGSDVVIDEFSLQADVLVDDAPANIDLVAVGHANFRTGIYAADQFKLELPGLHCDLGASIDVQQDGGEASADPELWEVSAAWTLDLNLNKLFAWRDLAGFSEEELSFLTGMLELEGRSEGPLGRLQSELRSIVGVNIQAEGTLVPVEFNGLREFIASGSTSLNVLDPGAGIIHLSKIDIQADECNIQIPKANLNLEKEEVVGTVAIQVDSEELSRRFSTMLGGQTLRSKSSALLVTISGTFDRPQFEIDVESPEAVLFGADYPEAGLALGDVHFQGKGYGRLDVDMWRFDSMSLETRLLTVDGPASLKVFSDGSLASATADLTITLPVGDLILLAAELGVLPEDTVGTGHAEGNIQIAPHGENLALSGSVRITNGSIYGSITKAVTIEDESILVEVSGSTPKDFSRLSLAGTSITATSFNTTLNGTIVGLPATPVAQDLRAELSYDPTDWNPVIQAFAGGQIDSAEWQPAKLTWSGAMLPQDRELHEWISGWTLTGEIGYTTWDQTGMRIEGVAFPINLSQGRMPVDYLCTVNGGSARISGEINLTNGSRLTIVGDNVGLNVGMDPMLSHLNPIFHTSGGSIVGTAKSDVTVSTAGPMTWASLDDLVNQIEMEGSVSANEIRITGSPLMDQLWTEFVPRKGEEDRGSFLIPPTQFTVSGGKLRYNEMGLKIGKTTLNFAGAIGFDDALELDVSGPLPSRFREKHESLIKYIGESVMVPLRGEITAPRFAIEEVLGSLAERALQRYLKDQVQNKLKDKLKDIFD